MKKCLEFFKKKSTICVAAVVLALVVAAVAIPLFGADAASGSVKALDAIQRVNGTISPLTGSSFTILADESVPANTPISLDSPHLSVQNNEGITIDGNLVSWDGTSGVGTPVDYLVLNNNGTMTAYCGSMPASGTLALISVDEKNVSAGLSISPICTTTKNNAIVNADILSDAPYSYTQCGEVGGVYGLSTLTGLDEFYYGDTDGKNATNLMPCSQVKITAQSGGYYLLPIDAYGNTVYGADLYMVYDRLYSFDITINSSVVEHSEDNGDTFFWRGDHFWINGDLKSNGKHNDRYEVNNDPSQNVKALTEVRPYTKTITGRIGDSFLASDIGEVIVYAAAENRRNNWRQDWFNLSKIASDVSGYRRDNIEINNYLSLNSYYDKVNFFRISDNGVGGAKLTYVLPPDTQRYRISSTQTAYFSWENYVPRTKLEYDVDEVDLYTTRPSILRIPHGSEANRGKSDHIQGRLPTNVMMDINGKTYSGNLSVIDVTILEATHNGNPILLEKSTEPLAGRVSTPITEGYESISQQETYMLGFSSPIPSEDIQSGKVHFKLQYRVTGTLVNENDPTDVISYPADDPMVYVETLSPAKLEQAVLACPRQVGYDVLIDLTEAIRADNQNSTIVKVFKIWNDEGNRYETRPTSITVELERSADGGNTWTSNFENSTVTMTGSMTGSIWTAQPDVVSDYYDANSGTYKQYAYRIKGESADGLTINGYKYNGEYETTIRSTDASLMTTVELTAENTLIPEETAIGGTKTWINDSNTGVAAVAIYQDGKFYDVAGGVVTRYTFENLPLADENGHQYVYTVCELDDNGNPIHSGETGTVDGERYLVTIDGYDITNTCVKHSVYTHYVDTEGNKISDDMNPYLDKLHGSDYNVRNVAGDSIGDYRYPTIVYNNNVYYYIATDEVNSDAENGELDNDKNITYIYDKLLNPRIVKKIIENNERVDSNQIETTDRDKTYTVDYVMTVYNPNRTSLYNLTVSDVVPDGLTVVAGNGYSVSTNAAGKQVVTFVISQIPANNGNTDGCANVFFTATLTDDAKTGANDHPMRNQGVIDSFEIQPDPNKDPLQFTDCNIASNTVTTTTFRRYNVTTNYVDTNGNVLRDPEKPYVGTLEGSSYNVRAVGEEAKDYRYPSIPYGDKIYYFVKVDETISHPEDGTLYEDKDITYVYDLLKDPTIVKKIIEGSMRVDSNKINTTDTSKTYTVDYVLTVTNPNGIPMTNMTVSDLVPVGLTAVESTGYQLTTDETTGRQTITFTIPTIAANGKAEVFFTGTLTADAETGANDLITNQGVITGADVTPDPNEDPIHINYNIPSNEVTTATYRQYNVVTKYVDTNGNTLHDPEKPYTNAPEGSSYNVRKVGDPINDYCYPTLTKNGDDYYFVEIKEEISDSERGELYEDKEITYVYDLIKDPTITKAVDKTLIKVDDQNGTYKITYTLTVHNPNLKPITNVGVSDDIPEGLAFDRAMNNGKHSNGVVTWTISQIAANGDSKVSYTVIIADKNKADNILLGGKAPYYNIAYVTNMTIGDKTVTYVDPKDEDSKGIPSNEVVTNVYNDDPTIEKTADKDIVSVGENIEYTIRVANTAKTPLYDVKVNDAIPDGMRATSASIIVKYVPKDFVATYAEQVTISADGSTVDAIIPCLGINGYAVITVNAVVTEKQDVYHNVAKITEGAIEVGGEDVVDPDIEDTHDSTPTSDPFINKVVDKSVARKGDILHYTLTVTNPVNHDLYDAVVTDTLPAGTEIVPNSITAGGTYSNGVITWTIAKIDKNNGTATVEFDVKVTSDNQKTLVNNCLLVEGVLDVKDDGKDNDKTTEYNKPGNASTDLILDPVITKARDLAIAGKDDTITYTLTVKNPDIQFDMHDVVVTDTIPEGLSFADILGARNAAVQPDEDGNYVVNSNVTARYDAATRTITWVIGEVTKSNGTVSVSFTADVIYNDSKDGRENAIWKNIAYITEATPDVNNDGTPDEEFNKEYIDEKGNKTNPSNIVETDTKYVLVVEYRAVTPDGKKLQPDYNDGGNSGTPYNVNNPTVIPDTIIDGNDVWVKKYIAPSDPLSGIYDSDKKVVIVYDKFDSAYSMSKEVSTDGKTWVETVEVDPGTTVYFRIRVFNHTDYDLSGLQLADELYLNSVETAYPSGWQSTLDSLASATIAANGTWESGAMSYEVSENASADDLYCNIATVSDDDPKTPDLSDDATVTVTPNPSLKITKVASIPADEEGVKYAAQNETVPFTLVVTNTGNCTLHNINVIDDTYDMKLSADADATVVPAGSVLTVIPSLEAGASSAPIVVYFDVPDDVPVGTVYDNYATAKAIKEDKNGDPVVDENGDPVELTDTDNDKITVVLPREPRLSIYKTVNDQKAVTAKPGEYVNYTVTVTNTGGVAAENVLVADYMFEGDNKLTQSWAINKTWVIPRIEAESSYVIEDPCFVWQVPVSAKDTVFDNFVDLYNSEDDYNHHKDPIDSDDAKVTVGGKYSIEVTKTADVDTLTLDDTAGYVIYVTNTSNAPLKDILVTESLDGVWGELPDKTDGNKNVNIKKNNADNTLTINALDAGDSVRLTFAYDIPDDTLNGDDILNVVTVDAKDPEDPKGDDLTDDAEASVRIVDEPLKVVKTANCDAAFAGQKISYTINVTNTGTRTLNNVVVTDDHDVIVTNEFVTKADGTVEPVTPTAGSADASKYNDTVIGFIDTLAPGECRSIIVDYTIPEGVELDSNLINTATAQDERNHSSSDNDNVLIVEKTIEPDYGLEIKKVANVAIVEEGDTITYTITVKNTGNGDLHNVVVKDSLPVSYNGSTYPAGNVIKTFETLGVGKTETVVVTYQVPKGYSADTLPNTAIADSDETEPVDSTATVTLGKPSVHLAKTVSSQKVSAGDKVYYTMTVTNTGNVKLTNLQLSDPSIGFNVTIPELAVGEKYTTPANTLYYTFDPSASNGTSFKNTANVSNGMVKGASSTVTATVTNGGNAYNNVPKTGDVATTKSVTAATVILIAAAATAVVLFVLYVRRRKNNEIN